MRRLYLVLILGILLIALVVPFAAAQGDQSIAGIAAGSADFSTLAAAVDAAGLTDALSGGQLDGFCAHQCRFRPTGADG